VKLQAVTLAAKLLVLSPAHATLTQLAKYVFALARYDRNYDVRDRGRMLQQLVAGVVPSIGAVDAKDVGGVVLRRAQVRVVLFEGKESVAAVGQDAPHGDTRERLGTLSLILGRDVRHARLLPDWLEHGVESSLRDSPDDAVVTATTAITAIGHVAASSRPGGGTGGHSTPVIVLTPGGSDGPSPAGSVPNKGAWTDLDAFYASESEDEEEEESEEDGEDGEDGEEEDGEEEERDRHQLGDYEERGAGPPRTSEGEGEEEEEEEGDSGVEESSSSTKAPVR
jgi:AP-3 complex subunit beta